MRIPAEPAERSRPGMSTDRITAAALQIVDTEGSQALTMRRLGQALDRKVMTLYRYVPVKARCWTASDSCTDTSSTSYRKSSTTPTRPTTCSGSGCTASPAGNSPGYAPWPPNSPATTEPPTSSKASH